MHSENLFVFGLGVCALVAASNHVNAQEGEEIPDGPPRWGSTFNRYRATDNLLALYTFEQGPCASPDNNGNTYFDNFADVSFVSFPTLVASEDVSCVASEDDLYAAADNGIITTGSTGMTGSSTFNLVDASVEYTGMSVEFWMTMTSLPEAPTTYTIMQLGSEEKSSLFSAKIFFKEGSNIPTLRIQTIFISTNEDYIEWQMTGFLTEREHHIVATYDTADSTHAAYIDGASLPLETIFLANAFLSPLNAEKARFVKAELSFLDKSLNTPLYSLRAFENVGAAASEITFHLLGLYARALTQAEVVSNKNGFLPSKLPVLPRSTAFEVVEDTPMMIELTDLEVSDNSSETSSIIFISLPQYGELTNSADNMSLPYDATDLLVGNLWNDDKPIWYHPAADMFGPNIDTFQVALLSDACVTSGVSIELCIIPGASIEFNIEARNDAPVSMAVQNELVFFGALMEVTMEFTDVDIIAGSDEQLTVNFGTFSELVTVADNPDGLESYDTFTTRFTRGSCTANGVLLVDGSSVELAASVTSLTFCFNSTNTKGFMGNVASNITYTLQDKEGLSSAEARLELDWVSPLRLCYTGKTGECVTLGFIQGITTPQAFTVVAYDMRQPSERFEYTYAFLFYDVDRYKAAGDIQGLGSLLDSSTTAERNSHMVSIAPSAEFIDESSNMLTVDLGILAAPNFYSLGPNGERTDLNGRDVVLASASFAPGIVYRLRASSPDTSMVSAPKELVIQTKTDSEEAAQIITKGSESIIWAGKEKSPFGSVATIKDSKAINDFTFFLLNVTCDSFLVTAKNISDEAGLFNVDSCVYEELGCSNKQALVVGTTQALNRFLFDAIRLYPIGRQVQRTGCTVSVASADAAALFGSVKLFVEVEDGPIFMMVASLGAVCIGLGLLFSVKKWNRNIAIVLQRRGKKRSRQRRQRPQLQRQSQPRRPRQKVPSVLVAQEVVEDANRLSVEKPGLYSR